MEATSVNWLTIVLAAISDLQLVDYDTLPSYLAKHGLRRQVYRPIN